VDLFLETDTVEAEKTDDLSKTVNYQEVYLLVKKEIAGGIIFLIITILLTLSELFPKFMEKKI
jgi:dihydroneopterin aldolase